MYFRQKFESTTTTVAKLLHIDQVDQNNTSNGRFKWKMIENKLKTDKKKRKVGRRKVSDSCFRYFLASY